MKIALAQINTTIGDFEGNIRKIKSYASKAAKKRCDLAVFPELALCGYPPKDFLEDANFIKESDVALYKLAKSTKSLKCAILVGYIGKNDKVIGKPVFNSAALINNGKLLFSQNKSLLPTYDVFDEGRYFERAHGVNIFEYKGKKLGISICEDIWNDVDFWKTRIYRFDPIEKLVLMGADILINLSSSPYYIGKKSVKERMLTNVARKYRLPLVYVNLVGGNDDLIFEGRSLYISQNGDVSLRMKSFQEGIEIVDTTKDLQNTLSKEPCEEEEVIDALSLGIKDYVKKCGFKQVVIGLSGGIDSAITAYLAVKALGKANVETINMPSKYSSKASITDSKKLAKTLGVKYSVISIADTFNTYKKIFKKIFKGKKEGITEENIQARIRANILMAVSNKHGKLVLSCGNKSELAVGYTTIYGDLSGGLAAISDVPKTTVYKIANFINRKREIIPKNIITKAPSAELKPRQKDSDSLPDYDDLDKILKFYIEHGLELSKIGDLSGKPKLAKSILNKVLLNEYKRNQAPPGLKITTKAFGYGRRLPIAHKFRF